MRSMLVTAVAASLLAMAFASLAQNPGGGQPGGGNRGAGASRPQGPASPESTTLLPPSSVIDLIRQRATELEEDLHLSPAQRPLWTAYATKLGALVNDVTRHRDALRFPKGMASQQFDFLADTARNRLTAVEDIADAGKSLYAALSPEQREIADRRLARLPMLLFAAPALADGAAPQRQRMQSDGPGK